MKVVDGSGRAHRVGRRWLPWRRRIKTIDAGVDLGGAPIGDDPVSMILTVITLVIAIPVLVVFVLSLSEVLLLLALVPIVWLWRVLFRRPWTIDVTRGKELVAVYLAADWSAARVMIADLVTAIESGRPWPAEGRVDGAS